MPKNGNIMQCYNARWNEVFRPSDDVDCILVADRAFLAMSRMAFTIQDEDFDPEIGPTREGPVSAIMEYSRFSDTPGRRIAGMLCWISRQLSDVDHRDIGSGRSTLHSMESMFGTLRGSGATHNWPLSIYPRYLTNERGLAYLRKSFISFT